MIKYIDVSIGGTGAVAPSLKRSVFFVKNVEYGTWLSGLSSTRTNRDFQRATPYASVQAARKAIKAHKTDHPEHYKIAQVDMAIAA